MDSFETTFEERRHTYCVSKFAYLPYNLLCSSLIRKSDIFKTYHGIGLCISRFTKPIEIFEPVINVTQPNKGRRKYVVQGCYKMSHWHMRRDEDWLATSLSRYGQVATRNSKACCSGSCQWDISTFKVAPRKGLLPELRRQSKKDWRSTCRLQIF